jgi:hypothetical protein
MKNISLKASSAHYPINKNWLRSESVECKVFDAHVINNLEG